MLDARPSRRALVMAAAGVLALALVLLVHGMRPGAVGDAPTAYLMQGGMQCLHDIGRYALTTSCHAYAEPLGYPLLSDAPTIFLGAVLMRLPGVGLNGAYLLAGTIAFAVGLAGGYGLARRLGMRPAVALWAATLYLVSPSVLGMVSFLGTARGFALLPAYVLADLTLLRTLQGAARRRMVLVPAGYAIVRVLALFTDGYSFVASGVIAVCLWIAWAGSRAVGGRWRTRLAGFAVIVVANLIAFGLYTAYVPGEYAPNPIGIFRAMGLDLVTLAEPTARIWLGHLVGLPDAHPRLWGDGTNANYNYVGFVCLALAIGVLVLRRVGRYAVALAAAGGLALVLSFGPSLKIADERPAITGVATYQSYLMPASAADVSLPWGGLYTAVPGLESMRATYRWFTVTRLALIMLGALAVEQLVRRRRWRVVAVVAAVAMTAELLPDIPRFNARFETARAGMRQVDAEVVPDLRAVTRPGDPTFFLSYDGAYNDYMANYLAAKASLHAYNAGGDKDVAFAAAHWPAPVGALAAPGAGADAVVAALRSGTVGVVVAPYFHLRLNTYSWPPTPAERARAQRAFAPILADRRLRVDRRQWLAGIRLR